MGVWNINWVTSMNIFDCCSHRYSYRCPTGRGGFMLLVDMCRCCGHLTPVREVTWREFRWLVRFNLCIKERNKVVGDA